MSMHCLFHETGLGNKYSEPSQNQHTQEVLMVTGKLVSYNDFLNKPPLLFISQNPELNIRVVGLDLSCDAIPVHWGRFPLIIGGPRMGQESKCPERCIHAALRTVLEDFRGCHGGLLKIKEHFPPYFGFA